MPNRPKVDPELTPGNGFFLQSDGMWGVTKIPPEVLAQAEFSGYLTIHGYKCSVFEMPDGTSWAQKSSEPETSLEVIAARIANIKY